MDRPHGIGQNDCSTTLKRLKPVALDDVGSSWVDGSVLDWYLSILCDAAGLDADRFSAAVMPKADRAVFHVPAGIDLSTCLTHEAQRPDVCTRLTELPRNVKGARISDQCGCDVSAYLTDLCCNFKIYCLSANLVSVLADCCLCYSQSFCN